MTVGKPFLLALTEIMQSLAVGWDKNIDAIAGSSDFRSIAEAVAAQVADISVRFDTALSEARPRAVWEALGFLARPATYSTGAITFTRSGSEVEDLFIPAGTQVRTAGEVYVQTLLDATLSASQNTITLAARCQETGPHGNVPGGTLTILASALRGIGTVTNALPFTGGLDAETIPEQRQRFQTFLTELNGTPKDAQTTLARNYVTTNGQQARKVLITDGEDDPSIPPGRYRINVFAPGGLDGTYASELLTYLRAFRAAGTPPSLFSTPGTAVPVAITLSVTATGSGAADAATAAVAAYFDSLAFGQKVSRENLITVITTAHPAILETTLHHPAADVIAGTYDVFTPATQPVLEMLG